MLKKIYLRELLACIWAGGASFEWKEDKDIKILTTYKEGGKAATVIFKGQVLLTSIHPELTPSYIQAKLAEIPPEQEFPTDEKIIRICLKAAVFPKTKRPLSSIAQEDIFPLLGQHYPIKEKPFRRIMAIVALEILLEKVSSTYNPLALSKLWRSWLGSDGLGLNLKS